MKKIIALAMLASSFQASAAEFKEIPFEKSQGGELQCKREANNFGEASYTNYKLAKGSISLAQMEQYYSVPNPMVAGYNEMRNAHLARVFKNEYKSVQESVDDLYQKCRVSPWAQTLDRRK